MPQLTQEASGGEGTRKKSTVAWGLSAGVAVLMLLQSLAGVVFPGLYRDVGWVTAAWYGNDLGTALVAVPLMAWSLIAVQRGSRRAELRVGGMGAAEEFAAGEMTMRRAKLTRQRGFTHKLASLVAGSSLMCTNRWQHPGRLMYARQANSKKKP